MGNSLVSVVIRDDGTVVCLDHTETSCFRSLGQVKTRRASHVEPDNSLLRPAFHMLRLVFGDKGWMAEFTRLWPCQWRVNLSPIGGPILTQVYTDRLEAIDSEVAWLNEHLT